MQEPSNVASWFIARSGETQGPYTWAQLRSAARQGIVRPRDWVWQKGMRKWVRASEQAGLIAPAPPPVPPPTGDSDDVTELGAVQEAASIHDEILSEAPDPAAEARPGPGPAPADEARPGPKSAPAVEARPGPGSAPAVGGPAVIGRLKRRTSPVAATRSMRPQPPSAGPGPIDGPSPDLLQGPPDERAPAGGDSWMPAPTGRSFSLGETTRQFLAAAGVSAKVRQRRQRRAVATAALGVGALVALTQLWPSSMPEAADEVEGPPRLAAQAAPRTGGAPLDRAEACRLTGDCRGRRQRRPTTAAAAGGAPARRNDALPETVGIGALRTEGGGPARIEGDGPVRPVLPEAAGESSLSAAQTATVKAKVSPSLKRCKGVYARSDVEVRVRTNRHGRVIDIAVPKGPGTVRRCLERRAKYWRFGRTVGRQSLALTVPAQRGVVRITTTP